MQDISYHLSLEGLLDVDEKHDPSTEEQHMNALVERVISLYYRVNSFVGTNMIATSPNAKGAYFGR